MKYFEDKGRIFMIVKPVKRLFHSKTVKSVMERGDEFVVNMNTGELTIFKTKKEKEPVQAYFVYAEYRTEDFGLSRLWLNTDINWSTSEILEIDPNSRIELCIKNANNNMLHSIVKSSRESFDIFIPRMRNFYERVLRDYK
jgi:hypothetical protein